MSSFVKGSITPPITYSLIEDVVAVDGGGGKRFRAAFLERYNASPRFRALLRDLTWFWGVPCLVVGVVLMALIFTVSREVAYGLGWGVPAAWAGLWTLVTIFWVRKVLREEEEGWEGPVWGEGAEVVSEAQGGEGGGPPAMEMAQRDAGSVSGTTI